MGKIRTRFIGVADIEEEQKKQQKERSKRKKEQSSESKSSKDTQKQDTPLSQDVPVENVQKQKEKKAKSTVKSSRSRPKVRGKQYLSSLKSVKADAEYSIQEAVKILKKASYAQFDESVEIHLNVTKTGLKGEVSLPHSTGRVVRVAFASDELLDKVEEGTIDFDILIAHPSFMPKLAKYARILGPKGLMPNPKNGTITTEPEKASEKFTSGTIQWKTESKFPIIHQVVSKMNSSEKEIEENIEAFLKSVGEKNIQSAFVSASMTPSVKLSIS